MKIETQFDLNAILMQLLMQLWKFNFPDRQVETSLSPQGGNDIHRNLNELKPLKGLPLDSTEQGLKKDFENHNIAVFADSFDSFWI